MRAIDRVSAPRQSSFYVCVLLLGALYALITPPSASRQELLHLLRARALSQGQVVTRADAAGPYYEAPAAFAELLAEYEGFEADPDARKDLSALLGGIFARSTPSKPTRIAALPVSENPLAYTPLVLAAWLGRALDLAPLGQLWLARLFGLAAYALLIGRALRLAQQFAWPWLALALCPAPLMLAASCSPDSIDVGMALALFALVARGALLPEQALSRRELSALVVLFVLLASCSPTYLFLAPALYAVRWRPDADQRARRRFTLLTTALALASVVFWLLIAQRAHLQLLEAQVRPQLEWMLTHPLKLARGWLRAVFKQSDDLAIEMLCGGAVFNDQMRFLAGFVTVIASELLALLSVGLLHARPAESAALRRTARWLWGAALAGVLAVFSFASVLTNHQAAAPMTGLSGSAIIAILPLALAAAGTAGSPLALRWLLRRRGFRVIATLVGLNLLCLVFVMGRYYGALKPPWPY